MQAAIRTILVVLFFVSPAISQEPHRAHHPWLRRITLAGACAASFWDLQTTRAGVARGATEANPLFADVQGRPRLGLMIGFKAGVCAASFATEEHFARRRGSDAFWTTVNGINAVGFAAIAIHNRSVAGGVAAPR